MTRRRTDNKYKKLGYLREEDIRDESAFQQEILSFQQDSVALDSSSLNVSTTRDGPPRKLLQSSRRIQSFKDNRPPKLEPLKDHIRIPYITNANRV